MDRVLLGWPGWPRIGFPGCSAGSGARIRYGARVPALVMADELAKTFADVCMPTPVSTELFVPLFLKHFLLKPLRSFAGIPAFATPLGHPLIQLPFKGLRAALQNLPL